MIFKRIKNKLNQLRQKNIVKYDDWVGRIIFTFILIALLLTAFYLPIIFLALAIFLVVAMIITA